MLAQEASLVFGHSPAGQIMFFALQAATAAILFTGGIILLTALFYGRTHIAGVEPGSQLRLHGMVGIGADGHLAMINPSYELLG